MNGENTACRCGHAVETHFMDTVRPDDRAAPTGCDVGAQFRGVCLGMLCVCTRYRAATAAEREGFRR